MRLGKAMAAAIESMKYVRRPNAAVIKMRWWRIFREFLPAYPV
jgi:hypothetical protein